MGPPTSRPTLRALTGLRFIAAMYVLVTHFSAFSDEWPRWAKNLATSGYTGVSLFFILSGFILTYTYLDCREATLRGTRRDFWVARVARVYPLYLLGLLIAIPPLVSTVINKSTSLGELGQSLILAPLMMQAWSPTAALTWNAPAWSLSAEAFFYLLFPFVLPAVARMRRSALVAVMVSAAGVALAVAVAQAMLFPDLMWETYVITAPPVRALEFVVGVGLGVGYSRYGWRLSSRLAAPCGVIIFVVLALTKDHLPHSVVSNALLLPLFCVLLLALSTGQSLLSRVLGSSTGMVLGEASYGVYLFQIPMYWFYLHTLDRVRPGFAISLPGVILFAGLLTVMAILTYRLVEVPARRQIRNRWGSRSVLRPA